MSKSKSSSKWDREHPEKTDEYRRRYYNNSSTQNSYTSWTADEIAKIIAPDRPSDRELSFRLGRSIRAIQRQRAKHRDVKYTFQAAPQAWKPPATLDSAISRYNQAVRTIKAIEVALEDAQDRGQLEDLLARWKHEQRRLGKMILSSRLTETTEPRS